MERMGEKIGWIAGRLPSRRGGLPALSDPDERFPPLFLPESLPAPILRNGPYRSLPVMS